MSLDSLEAMQELAAKLTLPPAGEEADWLGRLDRIMRDLRAKRRTVSDELDGPVTGTEYQVKESRSASRSYNTARILADFAQAGWDLHDLRNHDAVRLSWRWTELQRAYRKANVDLTVAHREVEDEGDIEEPPVGEVWSSRYSVEGI